MSGRESDRNLPRRFRVALCSAEMHPASSEALEGFRVAASQTYRCPTATPPWCGGICQEPTVDRRTTFPPPRASSQEPNAPYVRTTSGKAGFRFPTFPLPSRPTGVGRGRRRFRSWVEGRKDGAIALRCSFRTRTEMTQVDFRRRRRQQERHSIQFRRRRA